MIDREAGHGGGEAGIELGAPVAGRLVQHAGAWLLVAMVHGLGLYEEAFRVAQAKASTFAGEYRLAYVDRSSDACAR